MGDKGEKQITKEDDMAFFKTILKYMSRMQSIDNFEFRQALMDIIKKYLYKRQNQAKTISHLMKRESGEVHYQDHNSRVLQETNYNQGQRVPLHQHHNVPEAQHHHNNEARVLREINYNQVQRLPYQNQIPATQAKFSENLRRRARTRRGHDLQSSFDVKQEMKPDVKQEEKQEMKPELKQEAVKKGDLGDEVSNPLATAFANAFMSDDTDRIFEISDNSEEEVEELEIHIVTKKPKYR